MSKLTTMALFWNARERKSFCRCDACSRYILCNGLLQVDTVVICAGQEPLRALHAELTKEEKKKPRVFMIGGALEATELDAKRAIDQGTR